MQMQKGIRFPLRTGAWFALVFLVFLAEEPMVRGKSDPPRRDAPPVRTLSEVDASVRKIHDRINDYRTSQGLRPLVLDPFISKIAADHCRGMAEGKVAFGHQGIEKRAKTIQSKVKVRSIAENVGVSTEQAEPEEEVVKGWLRSPGHRKNILGDFELTGIGVAKKENEKYYFTQIFLKKGP